MEEVSIVGVDLAKQVFQVHGAASDGRVLFRKKLSRLQFPKFMATLPPCVVAMEACGTAHCPSSNDLRLFGLWKIGVSGSDFGLI